MFLLRKPSPAAIRNFLDVQGRLQLTYEAVGATANTPPPRYVVDHTRVRLGTGERVFRAAKDALTDWRQFRLGWVEAWSPESPVRVGSLVAILARSLGTWWLNACRVVAVVDEPERFGFAYGTLPGHAGTGEERFLIEWSRPDDAVWYDVLAFSRPRHYLARVGYFWLRRSQKRFGRESAAAMVRAVSAVE